MARERPVVRQSPLVVLVSCHSVIRIHFNPAVEVQADVPLRPEFVYVYLFQGLIS